MTDELIKALEEIIAMQPGGQSLTQVRYIAREALAAHRSQQEAAQEPVAVVESIGGPKSLPQLLWYVGFPRIGVMVKPGDKLYTAPSESEARDLSKIPVYAWASNRQPKAIHHQVKDLWLKVRAEQVEDYTEPLVLLADVRAALSASGQKGEPT